MRWSRKNNLVGLDIGTRQIKAAEIRKTKNGYTLKSLGIIENRAGVAIGNQPPDPADLISSTQDLITRYNIKAKNTAIAIGGNRVIIQLIRVSVDSPEKIGEVVVKEAEKRIPFDIDDVDIDFYVLPENGKSLSNPRVLVTAAPKNIVDQYTKLLLATRLKPCVLDVDILALVNVVAFNYDIENKNVVLIDIGASKISLCILSNGSPLFVHTVASGCNQINTEIARRNNCSLLEAEQIKALWPAEGKTTNELDEIESVSATHWCAQIAEALGCYTSTQGDMVIDRFYLSGGGANIVSFRRKLSDRTATEVVTVNPFNRVRVDAARFDMKHLKRISPQSAICMGLAIRGVDKK